jgi:outer membrane immunogenic protein
MKHDLLEKLDMRKFATMAAVAGLSVAMTATPAAAGAIEALFDEPPALTAGPLWTGFYAGAFAGGAWWDSATFSSVTTYDSVPPHSWGVSGENSFLGGATMGLNWQLGAFLLGIEGEVAYMGFKAGAADPGDAAHNLYGQLTFNDWEEFIGGRAGFLWGNALIYGKLGAVFAEYQTRVYLGTPAADGANIAFGDNTDAALAVGGGVEYALSQHWSAKIEYMYMDFTARQYAQGCRANGSPFAPCGFDLPSSPDTPDLWTASPGGVQTVKFGLNYRFMGWRDESPFK